MKRFLFTLFLIVAVLVTAVVLIKRAAPSTRLDGIGIGSSTHLRVGVDGLSAAMDSVTEMGSTWIREEIPWNEVQQAPGQFRWSIGNGTITHNFDDLVDQAQARKLKILAVLDGGPVFLAHVYPGMPVNPAELLPAWKEYVQAVVDRYGDRISAWEIGNRENTSEGWGRVMFPTASEPLKSPDPELYSQMLQTAYQIIKARNSSAKVILGGMELDGQDCSEDPRAFLAALQEFGGWQSFDALGLQLIHRNTWPEQNSSFFYVGDSISKNCVIMPPDASSILDEVQSIASFTKQFGEKRIWITELGYSAHSIQSLANGDSSNAAWVESDLLVRSTIPLLAEPSVEKVFWFTLADDPVIPGYAMGPFGQITLANLNAFIKGSKPIGEVQGSEIPEDVKVYVFQRDGNSIFVIWRSTSENTGEPMVLTGLQGDSAVAYAADVAEISSATAQSLKVNADGTIDLMVTRRPLIIVTQETGLAGRIQSTAKDQVEQVKESVDAGAKTLWEGAKVSISNQFNAWLNGIKDSIIQSIQSKLNQLFK